MNRDTASLLNTLKEAGQDFAWYPSTDQMIEVEHFTEDLT